MKAIRAHFDGKAVVVPPEVHGLPPGEVLLIFEDDDPAPSDAWTHAQEGPFQKVWDNDEDAEYDRL